MHEEHIDLSSLSEVITTAKRTENTRTKSKARSNTPSPAAKPTKPHKVRTSHQDHRLRKVGSINYRDGVKALLLSTYPHPE